MKTTKVLLGALAALSFVGISCQREEQIVDQPTEKIHMTLIASSDDETRSILQADGTTVLWGDNEQLHVFETINHAEGVRVSHTPSSVGVSTDGGETMSFDVALEPFLTGTSYVYNAVYPNSAVVETDNDDPTSLKFITPSTQKATATSFDGDADLLIAKQVTKNQQPTSLQVGFKRMLVLGKMTLTNVASEANVKSVKFSSPNKKITGRSKMNLTTGEAVQYGYDSENYVEVTYEDNIPANNLTVFFTCFPFQVSTGETFTVEVTTKDNEKFTKVVTIPEGHSLSFVLGENTVFSVNMDGIAPETVDNLAGKQYVILSKTIFQYYYMSSTLSTTSTKYYVDGEPNPSVAANAQVDFTNSRTNFPNVNDFWEIETFNENYAIKSVTTGKYISWSSENSAEQSDDPFELTISVDDDGLYHVASKTTPSRLLQYNSGSNPHRFAFYTSHQGYLYLIPVGPADTRTPLEEVTLSAGQDGNTKNVVVSWSGVEHAVSYTVALGNQSETIPLNSENQYQHTFTVTSYDTYEVTVTANPEEGYKESVATVSVTVADRTPMIILNKDEINNVDANGWSEEIVEGVYTLNDYATDSDISVTYDGTIVTDLALSNGSVILTIAENTDNEARSGSFTLTISNEDFTVQVNQRGKNGSIEDVINRALTGITGSNYTDWSSNSSASGAVYAGNSAGGNESVQLRSTNNSGIVSTKSGGKVKSITVTWNSETANGRTLNVYGKNTAYTSASELYNSSTQGTLLGTIVCGTSTELTITGDYEYVGLRSSSNAMYLSEIKITWGSGSGSGPAPTTPTMQVSPDNGSTLSWEDSEFGLGNAKTITVLLNDAATGYNVNYSDPDNLWTVSDDEEGTITVYPNAANTSTTNDKELAITITHKDQSSLSATVSLLQSKKSTGVTDIITADMLDATTTSYTDFSNVSAQTDARYAGNSAKDSSGNIQLRSKNSNSGIVSTTSGGKLKSIKITVGSGSNTIDVYGSNNAYTSADNLYATGSNNNQGTKIGSLSSTGTINVTGDYTYVGIRSNNGAVYISSIEITWE